MKVGFVSLSEALDMTTASGRALAGMLAVFAEFERVQPVWLQLSRDRNPLKWRRRHRSRGSSLLRWRAQGVSIRRRGLKGDAQGTYPDR